MLPHIGWVELTLVLVIVAMLFGVGKLPEVFGAVGKGIREFRKESTVADNKSTAIKPEQPAETTPENQERDGRTVDVSADKMTG